MPVDNRLVVVQVGYAMPGWGPGFHGFDKDPSRGNEKMKDKKKKNEWA